ncbi:hypothetical protein F4804DRAFT_354244 [Jackrogersella minutella]|nr:hypothetical protein F4804DRAFT_354244 [Jackrogersella minutella]
MFRLHILLASVLAGQGLAGKDSGTFASGFSKQRRDGDPTQPVGTNPIVKFQTQYLGQQTANNSCSHRDLGFAGELQGKWYSVFGDTLWCAEPLTDPGEDDTSQFHGMVRDSLSLLTGDPLVVVDLHLNNDSPVRHQTQFVPFDAAWGEDNTYGFGGTSLFETTNGDGGIFYLVNANAGGLKGAGVAKVSLVNGEPTVTQRLGSSAGYWWPAQIYPHYGDKAAFRDPRSPYVYAWGGAPSSVTDAGDAQYIYLLRVDAADAYDLDKYEYWWGAAGGGWKTGQPLTVSGKEYAVMWGVGQGQVVWSPGGYDVLLRTATALEGPWTPDVKVYTATPIDGGMTYAGVAYPYLDTSGRTLTISFTNDNHIEVIKVTFSK